MLAIGGQDSLRVQALRGDQVSRLHRIIDRIDSPAESNGISGNCWEIPEKMADLMKWFIVYGEVLCCLYDGEMEHGGFFCVAVCYGSHCPFSSLIYRLKKVDFP